MRLIDADALADSDMAKLIDKYLYNQCNLTVGLAAALMPEIKPEPVRNGRWITKDSQTAKCSCCGWWQRTKMYYLPDDIPAFSKCYRFCTSCGVQMDGGADDAVD